MWSLQGLQDVADVAFATASPLDLDVLNEVYGTRVSADKIELLPAPKLPGVNSGTRLVHWQRAWFERFCKRVAGRFDVCVSAYNPIHFGRPGIQLIGDFSFSEISRRRLYPNAEKKLCHRQSLLRRLYLSAGDFCLRGGNAPPFAERGDCAVANSSWSAERLEEIFGLSAPTVLYPPCPAAQPSNGSPPEYNDDGFRPTVPESEPRDPLGFVCLGRVSPEKEIETMIAVLDRVRAAGYPVTLDIAGHFGADAYARKMRRLIETRRDWIRTPGFLNPEEKAALFASRTFAIHACRVEAFGIAVAEMAAGGLIPVVPGEGGSREIAASSDLVYGDEDDAVAKILTLLESPQQLPLLRQKLKWNARQFEPEAFMEGLIEIVESFLKRPLSSSSSPSSSPSSTPHHVA